ncbi:MAG: flavin reductase [Kiritimatiellae bacterium]|nr:flavin reductase [Kiritimatiellia bacterium]
MKLRHDMLTHGVYVVAAQHHGKQGCLALAWATQTAKDHILIGIGQQSATRELILASKAFGLSLLREDQLDLARRLGAGSSRKQNKLRTLAYHTKDTGSPLLDDCAAAFDCRVEAVYPQGTTRLILGRIVVAELPEEAYRPLLYREEDYA